MFFFKFSFRIPILDFPSCIIGDSPPELTSDSLVIGDTAPYSWRNSELTSQRYENLVIFS